MALDILYQDEWLVAVNKPAGHMVHPADTPQPDDLVTMKILRDQLGQHIHTIHRIDRPTCGLLIFGLEPVATKQLQRDFENRKVSKTYVAVIEGKPEGSNWVCEEAIQKTEDAPFKDARTSFELQASIEIPELSLWLSLVEAKPETGRHHQIRRHLSQAGHAIVGDYRYAGIERSTELTSALDLNERMLLQAKSLAFTHPIDGSAQCISCPTEPLIQRLFADSFPDG